MAIKICALYFTIVLSVNLDQHNDNAIWPNCEWAFHFCSYCNVKMFNCLSVVYIISWYCGYTCQAVALVSTLRQAHLHSQSHSFLCLQLL